MFRFDNIYNIRVPPAVLSPFNYAFKSNLVLLPEDFAASYTNEQQSELLAQIQIIFKFQSKTLYVSLRQYIQYQEHNLSSTDFSKIIPKGNLFA